ncbi:MAG: hypothetical protein IT304_06420 [Dehalococcoidia bacterium]|nr:hypothetical protein [Dehalococcoidia bacterium]
MYGVTALYLLLVALQLTKAGAGGLSDALTRLDVSGPVNAVGFGWAFAYLALSGSPVAALSVTLLSGGAFSELEAFAAIGGSRLGASLIVILVGLISYARHRGQPDGLAVGVIAFLTTLTTQVPALLIGLLMLDAGILDDVRVDTPAALLDAVEKMTAPLVTPLVDALPGFAEFAAGAGVLLLSFTLVDRAMPPLRERPVRDTAVRPQRRAVFAMFGLGAAITLLTLSVAVSVSLLVPLALRGYVRRDHVIPYVMGANITTFVDTLVVAMLLGGQAAFVVVLAQMLAMTTVAALILPFVYGSYSRGILATAHYATSSTTRFAGFVLAIAAVPAILLFI